LGFCEEGEQEELSLHLSQTALFHVEPP
jgi:hypothetical protein